MNRWCRNFSSNATDVSERRPSTAEAAFMTDIGCRRIFNSDHDIFRQSARKFFQNEVAPFHAEYDYLIEFGCIKVKHFYKFIQFKLKFFLLFCLCIINALLDFHYETLLNGDMDFNSLES